MSVDAVSLSTEFDIVSTRRVQTSTLETTETFYKFIPTIDQSNLEFLIPADHDTYIELNIHLYIRCKRTNADGTDLENTYHSSDKLFLTFPIQSVQYHFKWRYDNLVDRPLSLSRLSRDVSELR